MVPVVGIIFKLQSLSNSFQAEVENVDGGEIRYGQSRFNHHIPSGEAASVYHCEKLFLDKVRNCKSKGWDKIGNNLRKIATINM